MNDNYEELDIMNMDTTPEQNVEDAAESTPTGPEKKPNRKNRKRNIITAIVILLMLASVTACGNKKNNDRRETTAYCWKRTSRQKSASLKAKRTRKSKPL